MNNIRFVIPSINEQHSGRSSSTRQVNLETLSREDFTYFNRKRRAQRGEGGAGASPWIETQENIENNRK